MNPAQRVAGSHHRLRRRGCRIELQRLEFGVERCKMLLRLVTKDAIKRGRQRDVAHRGFLGLDHRLRWQRIGDPGGASDVSVRRNATRCKFDHARCIQRPYRVVIRRRVRIRGHRFVELEHLDHGCRRGQKLRRLHG